MRIRVNHRLYHFTFPKASINPLLPSLFLRRRGYFFHKSRYLPTYLKQCTNNIVKLFHRFFCYCGCVTPKTYHYEDYIISSGNSGAECPPRPDIENTKRKQAGADFTTSACFSYMIKGKSTRGLLRCGMRGLLYSGFSSHFVSKMDFLSSPVPFCPLFRHWSRVCISLMRFR